MSGRGIVLAVCCFGPVLAQNADWRFAHPDAKVFIGAKLRRLRESQIGTIVRGQFHPEQISALPSLPGSDLLNQIDEVLVSSPGRADDAPQDSQPPVLVRIGGDFDANKVESFFVHSGAKLQKYRHYRVFRQKGDGDMAASLVDPHTLLIGDAPSLFSALERMEWTDAPKNPLLVRAAEMQSSFDLWALFAVTPSSLSGAHLPQLASLEALRGLDVGVSVSDGLAVRLGLETDSNQQAAKLAAELEGLLASALKQHGAPPMAAELAKAVHLMVEDSSVRVQARFSPEQVKKAALELQHQVALQRAQMAGLRRPAADNAQPAVIEPQKPRVIRIEGLDDGPREIPYK